eukprot:52000-Eustigmatos_ZCMA.PRE.1
MWCTHLDIRVRSCSVMTLSHLITDVCVCETSRYDHAFTPEATQPDIYTHVADCAARVMEGA